MSVNITALWMHADFLETPSNSSLLQLLFCADLTGSAWGPFTCLQRSCLITPCQKVNKIWSARWMVHLTLFPTWICQSRLLTAPAVPLVSLITQNLLFSAAGNGKGLLSNGLIQFASKCLHCPWVTDLCFADLTGCLRHLCGAATSFCRPKAARVWEIYPYPLFE